MFDLLIPVETVIKVKTPAPNVIAWDFIGLIFSQLRCP